MVRFGIALMLLSLCSCKVSTLYPVAGSVGGATVGSLAGPGGAADGALGDYGVGAVAQDKADGKSASATAVEDLQALT